MAISEETKKALYKRANGRCECQMNICSHHTGRCPHALTAGWEAHHKTASGPDNLGNLIAMCVPCHKNTRTYGRS
jgi:hypothetical protein